MVLYKFIYVLTYLLICTSMYGCELWYLDDSKINEFCTAWRKGLRRIWNLPYNTHIVTYCTACPTIYLYLIKCADDG